MDVLVLACHTDSCLLSTITSLTIWSQLLSTNREGLQSCSILLLVFRHRRVSTPREAKITPRELFSSAPSLRFDDARQGCSERFSNCRAANGSCRGDAGTRYGSSWSWMPGVPECQKHVLIYDKLTAERIACSNSHGPPSSLVQATNSTHACYRVDQK